MSKYRDNGRCLSDYTTAGQEYINSTISNQGAISQAALYIIYVDTCVVLVLMCNAAGSQTTLHLYYLPTRVCLVFSAQSNWQPVTS